MLAGWVTSFALLIVPIVANKYPKSDDYVSLTNFTQSDAKPSDVKYRLFRNGTNGILHDVASIKIASFDRKAATKFLIHGWLTDEKSLWYDRLRDEYFKKGAHNVIYVDWSAAGTKKYSVASANVKVIGAAMADFILRGKFELDKTHVIGHSLGAHVAGFVGKSVYEKSGLKLGRITALDAAGPKFQGAPETNRLAAGDARFVDCVHTDDGHYGFTEPCGRVDFYANGGKNQPGCPSLDVDDNCSHARSTLLFIESVNSNKFVAKKIRDFVVTEEIIFGENAPINAEGMFYFDTNSSAPFAAD